MLNNMKLRRSSSTLKSLQPIELPERSPLMSQSPTPSQLTEPQLPIKLSDLKRMEQIGSATVYKVVHKPTEQLYALIEIDPRSTPRGGVGEAPDDPREPNLRDVDNPNVVKCHNIFDADESKVLLEFMDGGSLEGKHIPNEEALSELARQILTWLTYLHKRRVVHRDIKPSNLLVNAGNQVKLADVGVDRIVSVATIEYMSPERISTDDNQGIYDAYAGDVWSFGVSILELYMGRFPFNLGDWANLMKAICMSQPPEAPATASRELRHFISCCLQREPSKRMSAAQLLQHPFISGSETAAGSTLPTLNF